MTRIKHRLKEFRALRVSLNLKFIIGIAVTLIITMGLSFYFISKKHEELIMKQMYIQTKALYKQIVITRKWIADHGGVFVLAPWKSPSPYLKEAYIQDASGKKYIKEGPAMVTKELSKYAKKEGIYWFHITSLKLINPENAPDDFEKASLVAFENGDYDEYSRVEKIESSYFYRYIAPLYIERPCLKCHSHQNYQVGDVRGAISIAVPMDHAISMVKSEKNTMVFATIATISVLMIILYLMMKELVLRPVHELKSSMDDFSSSKSKKVEIIRTGDELEDLSRSFVELSDSLSAYHTDLEERVSIATKGLEDANRRLMELNDKKSNFIAEISHELRTPLTSIKGAMDYISSRFAMHSGSDKDMEDLESFFEVIRKNADRLGRMVNDTLDIERMEAGMLDLHCSDVSLLPLIKEVILSIQSIASEKNISFAINVDQEIYVYADEDRIRQVLINLISNSINFSPVDSEIKVYAVESERSVKVSIRDEGPGIPAEVQKKIFDKFYTIGKRHGTGLGLAICKGIIEAHNGEIGVACENGENESTICFTLPKT